MSKIADQDRVARSTTRVRGFADPEMDFQLLRSLGEANYMGGAVGEILAAVRGIRYGDPRIGPQPLRLSVIRRKRSRAGSCRSIR